MDTPSAPIPVIKVLFTLIPGVDALSILGPLEVLNQAQHNPADPCKPVSLPSVPSRFHTALNINEHL